MNSIKTNKQEISAMQLFEYIARKKTFHNLDFDGMEHVTFILWTDGDKYKRNLVNFGKQDEVNKKILLKMCIIIIIIISS